MRLHRVVTVNPGDTNGAVQMINVDTGDNSVFNAEAGTTPQPCRSPNAP